MEADKETLAVLDQVLGLDGRAMAFGPATPLLGAVPEFDSMAVTALLTALEERFGFVVDDDEIDGRTFSTIGTLQAFVRAKRGL